MTNRGGAPLLGSNEIVCRIYGNLLKALEGSPAQRLDQSQGINLIPKEINAHSIVRTAQINIHGAALGSEASARKLSFRAVVQRIHQLVEQRSLGYGLAHPQLHRLLMEVLRIAYSVKAADRTDYNHVPATAEQGARSGKTQLLNLVIDGKILLNIGIRCRKISLRLVVVVV